MIQDKSSRKIWFSIFFAMAAVFTVLFMVMVRPVQKRVKKKLYTYEVKLETLNQITSSPEKVPSGMLLKEIKSETEFLKGAYDKAVKELCLENSCILPENAARPSIYWLNLMRKTKIDIEHRAKKSGLKIPADLTFSSDVPDDSEVPALLEKLKIVDDLISIAVIAGLKSISEMQWGESKIVEESGNPFIKKSYINFLIAADIESMIKFISFLNEADSFYAIESFEIDGGGEILKARVLLSAACFPRPEDISGGSEKMEAVPRYLGRK